MVATTELELYHRMRECLENPDPNKVPDSQLSTHLSMAAEWLAAQLKYPMRADTLTIIADQQEYPLPADFAMMISVIWNDRMLEPTSMYRLDRQGGNWRALPSSNPMEYFVFGRTLNLKPAPSSGAVTTDPTMVVRYLGSPLPIESGTIQLGEMDQNLLVFKAVQLYCRTHIRGEDAEANALRAQNMALEIAEWLPLARLRAQNALKEYRPRYQPEVVRRSGAR